MFPAIIHGLHLHITPLPASCPTVQVLAWSGVKVRSEAEIEKLLVTDVVEDERAWAATEEEEIAGVKLEVAEMLWMELLADTAHTLAELDEKLGAGTGAATGMAGTAVGGGRTAGAGMIGAQRSSGGSSSGSSGGGAARSRLPV